MLGAARRCARTLAVACGLLFVFAASAELRAQTAYRDVAAFSNLPIQPFGLAAYQAPAGPLWVKWRGLDAGLAADTLTLAECRSNRDSCSPAASRFLAIVDEARGLDGRRRLGIVNRTINHCFDARVEPGDIATTCQDTDLHGLHHVVPSLCDAAVSGPLPQR